MNPTNLFVVLVVPVVVVAVDGTIPLPAGSAQIKVPLEVSLASFEFVALQQVHNLLPSQSLFDLQTFQSVLGTGVRSAFWGFGVL